MGLKHVLNKTESIIEKYKTHYLYSAGRSSGEFGDDYK
jgi:hypothetical protein